jgi:hypothetical protein
MVERLEAEQDSIRGSVADAIAAAEAAPVSPDPNDPEKAQTPAADAATETSTEQRAAPDKKDEKTTAKTDVSHETPSAKDAKTPSKTPAKPEVLAAPANWPEASKAMFAKAPPEQQKFLLERHKDMEADYTKKTQDLAAQRKEYETIDKIFAPHETKMREQGFTKSSMVQAWANVELNLMNPATRLNTISRIIGAYKIPADQIAATLGLTRPAGQNGTQQTQQQPAAQEPWRQELGEIKQRLDAEDRARQETRANQLNTEILNFRGEKDEKGTTLHPHFDDVEQTMVKLVAAAQARGEPIPSIKELYEDAVWANPSTRTKMLEERTATETAKTESAQQEAQRKEREAARAKAEQAKRASKSVTGSPGAGASPNRRQTAKTLRDELMSNVEDAENSAAA